ncbi:hypothetical protein OAL70_05295, partial [Pelagibacteraceae bacterium]|nr:hypothetical protein [Pelagibacteraceae bacterium]
IGNKKLLAIIVLGLMMTGCSESKKLVILDCKLMKGNFEVIIDLNKNTMKFFEWDPYTITSITETEITANNLGQLKTSGQLRHFLMFKRYGGEFISKQVYQDGTLYKKDSLECKKSDKVF